MRILPGSRILGFLDSRLSGERFTRAMKGVQEHVDIPRHSIHAKASVDQSAPCGEKHEPHCVAQSLESPKWLASKLWRTSLSSSKARLGVAFLSFACDSDPQSV